jgi:integrase
MTFDDANGPGAEEEARKFCATVNAIGPRRALEAWGFTDTVRQPANLLTVGEYLTRHIDHLTGLEEQTIRQYRAYLKNDIGPHLGDIPLSRLTREDIALWIKAIEVNASAKTVKNKRDFLGGVLNQAVKDAAIGSNPCTGVKLARSERKEMVFLTREEYGVIRDAVTAHWQPMVEFLVTSGCRFSEATALRPSDVDRTANTVRITKAWKKADAGYKLGPPKTARSVRTINVPVAVLDALDYSGDWLFLNRAGGPVRTHGFNPRVWYPALQRAQLEKRPRVHDLRHTCASWLIAAGVPLPVIQRRLGHESIETTVDVYGHLDRSSDQAAAEALGKML